MSTMARIHLIESSKDKDLAERFEQALKRHRSVSSDISFLVPGLEWRRSLREAVLAADGLVAIFTANSVREDSNMISSQWMAADIGAARALGKFVIPVIIGDNIRFPALVDDIFVAQAGSEDAANLTEVINQVEDAIRVHTERREKEHALSLPTGYEHLASSVLRFHEDGPYDQSVFVMMKFADPTALEPNQHRLLEDIWGVLVRTLADYGLTPSVVPRK
jgi:TIR domain